MTILSEAEELYEYFTNNRCSYCGCNVLMAFDFKHSKDLKRVALDIDFDYDVTMMEIDNDLGIIDIRDYNHRCKEMAVILNIEKYCPLGCGTRVYYNSKRRTKQPSNKPYPINYDDDTQHFCHKEFNLEDMGEGKGIFKAEPMQYMKDTLQNKKYFTK